MSAPIYWYNLLTRERMYCAICYLDAQKRSIAATAAGEPRSDQNPWVRIADPAWFKAGFSMINPHTRGPYLTKLRAAFRRHWLAVHVDSPINVAWSR